MIMPATYPSSTDYQFTESRSLRDDAWDDFLESTELGQFQQSNQVGDGRPINMNSGGQVFLRAVVLHEILLEALCLFQRVEAFALDEALDFLTLFFAVLGPFAAALALKGMGD